ncbi:MAG TPA: hypothetical protein VKS22_04660 [Candidatus Binataceae bacterium]|nr:hypothetical protein [Candidatus Binataceae bacterium]
MNAHIHRTWRSLITTAAFAGCAIMLGAALLHARPTAAPAQTTLFLTDAPSWTHYFCDSSEADPDGSASLQGIHCYPSLTVPLGAVLTVTGAASSVGVPADSPRGTLQALVNGPCTIAGEIDAAAVQSGVGNGGGSGGGGGGAAATDAGSAGGVSNLFGTFRVAVAAQGGLAGAIAAAGKMGSTPTTVTQRWIWNTASTLGVLGGGAGGNGGAGRGVGGTGGGGGGGVALACNSINFTGAINVSGGDGGAGAAGGGGGGGGGGGVVILATPTYVANSGVTLVNGGTGGAGSSGAGAGGPAGSGWSNFFTLQAATADKTR